MTPDELLNTKFGSAGLGVEPITVKDWLKKGEAARQGIEAVQADVDGLHAELAELRTAVAALTTGGIDVNALAAKVADVLAERLRT